MKLFVLAALLVSALASEVVILDSSNFEHLTQASTGSTTGDWLVKFYAPWCGHCKKMEPMYEELAQKLKGEVNVAKVDVPANRDLGTRFEIKGFPTLKFFSKGKVYTYKGKRTVDDIIEFVKGDYMIQTSEEVNPPFGFFGQVGHVYRHAYKTAGNDLRKGRFFTVDVFLVFLPVFFVLVMTVLLCAPMPKPSPRRRQQPPSEQPEADGNDEGDEVEDEQDTQDASEGDASQGDKLKSQ